MRGRRGLAATFYLSAIEQDRENSVISTRRKGTCQSLEVGNRGKAACPRKDKPKVDVLNSGSGCRCNEEREVRTEDKRKRRKKKKKETRRARKRRGKGKFERDGTTKAASYCLLPR